MFHLFIDSPVALFFERNHRLVILSAAKPPYQGNMQIRDTDTCYDTDTYIFISQIRVLSGQHADTSRNTDTCIMTLIMIEIRVMIQIRDVIHIRVMIQIRDTHTCLHTDT